jgi:Fe2+ transport system protein B
MEAVVVRMVEAVRVKLALPLTQQLNELKKKYPNVY